MFHFQAGKYLRERRCLESSYGSITVKKATGRSRCVWGRQGLRAAAPEMTSRFIGLVLCARNTKPAACQAARTMHRSVCRHLPLSGRPASSLLLRPTACGARGHGHHPPRSESALCKHFCFVTQSCLTLCNPTGGSLPEILQARTLECVAMPSSRGSSQPRNGTWVSRTAGGCFTI